MRKTILFLCVAVLLFFSISSVTMAIPVPGTWTSSAFIEPGFAEGILEISDPGLDLSTIGDILVARDNSSESTWAAPYYWHTYDLTRDWFQRSDPPTWTKFDNGQPIEGFRTYETARSSGILELYGDHMWGHGEGTTYSADVQSRVEAIISLTWDGANSEWDWVMNGQFHLWGVFQDDPYSVDVTGNIQVNAQGVGSVYPEAIMGNFTNLEMTIKPIPEPATMLLLGSGLVGLAGFRRKNKK